MIDNDNIDNDKNNSNKNNSNTISITMKRLPCLICSVNITFIKTKRGICL